MAKQRNPNLEILALAVARLGPLADEMVFLGGCATGLLLTDSAAPPLRISRDVDVIVETATRSDYYRLSEKLRERGFVEDKSPDAPLCRWRADKVILDVMPTDPDILGFTNRWYKLSLGSASSFKLPSGLSAHGTIRVVSAPYFLATKLEAFDGRGKGDFFGSHDMEDIVALLDGRPEIVDEVECSEKPLRFYLAQRFEKLLKTREFLEALPGHLPPDEASQLRIPIIMRRIKSFGTG